MNYFTITLHQPYRAGVENNIKLVIQKSEDYALPVDYKVCIVGHIYVQTNGLPSGSSLRLHEKRSSNCNYQAKHEIEIY